MIIWDYFVICVLFFVYFLLSRRANLARFFLSCGNWKEYTNNHAMVESNCKYSYDNRNVNSEQI